MSLSWQKYVIKKGAFHKVPFLSLLHVLLTFYQIL